MTRSNASYAVNLGPYRVAGRSHDLLLSEKTLDALQNSFTALELLQEVWEGCTGADKADFRRFQTGTKQALQGKQAAPSGQYLAALESDDPKRRENANRVLRDRQHALDKVTGKDFEAQLNYAFLKNKSLMDTAARIISEVSSRGGVGGPLTFPQCLPPIHAC